MLMKTALRHYGNKIAIARALDISPAAVSKWKDIVPMESATALEILTGGELKVDPRRYPRIKDAMARRASA